MQYQTARSCAFALAGSLFLATPTTAQVAFSLDWHGPTISVPDSAGGMPITAGDILIPAAPGGYPFLGPLPPPAILISGGLTGLGLPAHPGCIGLPPGTPCPVEVDAISFGFDFVTNQNGFAPGEIWFSTDEYAGGFPGSPVPPAVWTEFLAIDLSADLMTVPLFMPPGPLPPFTGPVANMGAVDGNGMPSLTPALCPGLGLIEPNPPTFMPPDPGDNVDAINLQIGPGFPPGGVYFSVDDFFPDPCTGIPATGTAGTIGISGADILFTPAPGALPWVWAPAPMLGLMIAGPDDLDALAIAENGSGAFEPSLTPYDWVGGATDMVLFSVRRGSAVIGMPDSFFGIPIEEGDILTTPTPGGSPFPGIFIAAENIGLSTFRSGPGTGPCVADDLIALDFVSSPLLDCNGNGIEDAVDIGTGVAADLNNNGIPDSCDPMPFCFCGTGSPCGNPDGLAGCANSTGVGALLDALGSTSVTLDNLVLVTNQLPLNQFGVYFMGPAPVGPFPFGDGFRCVGGGVYRYSPPQNSGAMGIVTRGPGLVSYSHSTFPPSGRIGPGQTWNFQFWYRDPFGPCGFAFNTSNALAVLFGL